MSRYKQHKAGRRWSGLKKSVEALFEPTLELVVHCNVFCKRTKEFVFEEPRHWFLLGRGRAGRIIWDFPGPFLRDPKLGPPRSDRGPPIGYWEKVYGWAESRRDGAAAQMRAYLDRPRTELMSPFHDPWELGAILRAADRRLGRDCLLHWAAELDTGHPALCVIEARFGALAPRSRPALETT